MSACPGLRWALAPVRQAAGPELTGAYTGRHSVDSTAVPKGLARLDWLRGWGTALLLTCVVTMLLSMSTLSLPLPLPSFAFRDLCFFPFAFSFFAGLAPAAETELLPPSIAVQLTVQSSLPLVAVTAAVPALCCVLLLPCRGEERRGGRPSVLAVPACLPCRR